MPTFSQVAAASALAKLINVNQTKEAAPRWAKMWNAANEGLGLSAASKARIAESMAPGQLRTLGHLGTGSFNHAFDVAGRLPSGQAGEFVRKIPVAGGNAASEMYPGMMESSRILANRSPGGVAQYLHYDPAKGSIYQQKATGATIPMRAQYDQLPTGMQEMLKRNYPGIETPAPGMSHPDLGDVRPMNLKMQGDRPMLYDWQHELPNGNVAGQTFATPLAAGHELPNMRSQFGIHPQVRSPAFNQDYQKNLLNLGQTSPAMQATLVDHGVRPDYFGTEAQRVNAASRYYLGNRLPAVAPPTPPTANDRLGRLMGGLRPAKPVAPATPTPVPGPAPAPAAFGTKPLGPPPGAPSLSVPGATKPLGLPVR